MDALRRRVEAWVREVELRRRERSPATIMGWSLGVQSPTESLELGLQELDPRAIVSPPRTAGHDCMFDALKVLLAKRTACDANLFDDPHELKAMRTALRRACNSPERVSPSRRS